MTNAQPQPKLQWTLGDRLYKSLRLARISNKEMADVLGVAPNTVGNYIADRTPIKDGALRVWAMKTGVPYVELKTGEPSPDSGGDGGGAVTRLYPQGQDLHPARGWNDRYTLTATRLDNAA